MQTVYIDVLISVNVYINYLLLVLTARFAGCRQVRTRLALGAILGAISSCTILLDIPSKLLSAGIKIITAAMMTLTAFEIKSFKAFIKLMIILTAVTFCFAGAMIGIDNIMSTNNIEVTNYSVYLDISPISLIFLTLSGYVLISLYSKIRAGKTQKASACRLTICNEGKSITLDALLDTGNTLKEPFSGLPVVVVSEKNIYHLMPDGLKNYDVKNPQPTKNIRLIPYTSVGGSGLLAGFMPESIKVEREGRECITQSVYIAVADRGGDVPALINPDLLD